MTTTNPDSENNPEANGRASENAWLREVARALRSIRYGSVELTVHDGRVVELNKTERIRKSSS
ncbi:MAG TPA: YezD family protein [Terriglobales bacterium]|jgi:hypothetical protein